MRNQIPPQSPGPLVVGEMVILYGAAIDVVLDALQFKASRMYRETGMRPSPAHQRLESALLSAMAANGVRTDIDGGTTVNDEYVTTKQLAAMQGCSERQARRIADKLDARFDGRQKLIPLRAAQEHLDGKQAV
ncbi:hypothetical protein NJB1907f44_48940 [Mycobacterium marinum]|uniref:hypothetical protein n=1 Tax=Mycobacterium marinum TaxID=1781 RepID=UPI000E3C8C89|nr:hypothetical protein [Mycobacterium marinum]RFZ30716.1 hypothetical protein KST_05032 [Mycobacterium marinum]GJN99113.1 hypothetical protein NJB1907E8_50290 [Mycobacterium marinum]GJO06033.1 hypothetical protein NJB1907E90_16730 [Mycobacterium marinum]GJO10659.1 hypothetical protein NJB1808e29_46630 [Mycobacterium marinum]GJO14478.1 hypothetical protein NJB1907f34b_50950 [Mycobacterium marinum]